MIEKRVYCVLKKFDRLPSNPDDGLLNESITAQLQKEGRLLFFVFVCQKSNYAALSGPKPEEYMPVVARRDDLFQPRVPKIKKLQQELAKLGIPTELCFLIGDFDFEIFKLPFLKGVEINPEVFAERKQQYAVSLAKRVTREFGNSCVVFSLSELGIGPDITEPQLANEDLADEMGFIRARYSEGRYGDPVNFPEAVIQKMTDLKLRCYGNQGYLLEGFGPGILLQTEGGPERWLWRTRMLRCTGAKAVPAIYPWIRQEELAEIG